MHKIDKEEELDPEDYEFQDAARCCDRAVCCTKRGWQLFFRAIGCRRGQAVRGPRDVKNLESILLPIGAERNHTRPDNTVSSGKYTIYDFLPLATALQFRRAVNVYFLFQVLLLLIGYFQPTWFEVSYLPWGTMLVLAFVVGVTLITEAYDDYYRHYEDKRENSKPVIVINRQGRKLRSTWGALTAGDLVLLRNREICPADVVVLETNRDNSVLNVETSSIDGETNLKIKSVSREMHAYIANKGDKWTSNFTGGQLEYEEPNSLLNFNGTFHFSDAHIPVGFDSLVLRGSEIRNTDWVIAICVYCGAETKLVMSKRKAPPSKFATLDLLINKIVLLTVIQSLVFTVVAVISLFVGMPSTSTLWYMGFSSTLDAYVFPGPLAFLITYCNFFSNVVPIDLYITIEIANIFQSYFLSNDVQMYDAKSDTRTKVKTTSLISEIGQVSHIFSDKTGTLTQNVMRLVALALPTKRRFGYQVGEQVTAEKRPGNMLGPDAPAPELFEDYIQELAAEEAETAATATCGEAHELALALVLCHNVIIDFEEATGKLRYNAQSPDEEALVKCIAELGFNLLTTDGDFYTFRLPTGEIAKYRVLASFAFSSERKRMSILVQRVREGEDDGEDEKQETGAVLYMKGADNVVADRSLDFNSQIELDLDSFAQAGLRTLLFSKRELDARELASFLAEYDEAKVQIGAERKRALEALAERVEQSMTILGSSGIEDALQDGVAETIQMIRDASIKLWVLTGDKVATAINIGFTCKLITPTMHQIFLNDSAKDAQVMEDILFSLTKASEGAPTDRDLTSQSLCLICTGSSLANILAKQNGTKETQAKFLAIAQFCDVVLCCRVSPIQKALLVESVNDAGTNGTKNRYQWSDKLLRRKRRAQVTLAIGDGLNDVPMIQAAQVGVGISGKEGLQAANNADFSIAQFRFLQRLLFVHGRLSYRRNATLFQYVCYSWQVLAWPLFFYLYYSLVSGQQVYVNTYYVTLFAWLCNFVIVVLACTEHDISPETALLHPKVSYDVGRLNKLLNYRTIFLKVFVRGLAHAVLLYFIVLYTFPYENGSLDVWGSTMYMALFAVMVLSQCQLALTWNWLMYGAVGLIICCYFLGMTIVDLYLGQAYVPLVFTWLWPTAYAQATMILGGVVLFEYATFGIKRLFAPTKLQLLMEHEHVTGSGAGGTTALGSVLGALKEGGDHVFVLPAATVLKTFRGKTTLGKQQSGFYEE